LATAASGCVRRVPASNKVVEVMPTPQFAAGYEAIQDAGYTLPAISPFYTVGVNRRMEGLYTGEGRPGTIDVDPYAKFLYLVNEDYTAIRYPVGVGRQGRSISGRATVQLKKKWPGWTPTQNMLRTEPDVYGPFKRGIPGGIRSPLGARALYLYRGGRDTFYRIHGTNDLTSIGNSGSAGCIRMFNQDIIDLYNRVQTPMEVIIRTEAESLRVDPEYFGRGVELPAVRLDPNDVYGPEALARDPGPDFDADRMPVVGLDTVEL
jgi:lipoprotein-anchoring transpeptidase ErfK/SrfK